MATLWLYIGICLGSNRLRDNAGGHNCTGGLTEISRFVGPKCGAYSVCFSASLSRSALGLGLRRFCIPRWQLDCIWSTSPSHSDLARTTTWKVFLPTTVRTTGIAVYKYAFCLFLSFSTVKYPRQEDRKLALFTAISPSTHTTTLSIYVFGRLCMVFQVFH